ncbi:hypothetical protein C8J57DRAFT_1716544 [Mycena rebaudengoi]|nr:hypothetical protein C8J57DRAFT_1716544 [Mycena rebaudengoi]
MRVPQEIVDEIIDHCAMSEEERTTSVHWHLPGVASLKACALTCRSFLPRSQMHLFATITCDTDTPALFHFYRLLSGSPHIGPLYVRSFILVGVNEQSHDILADSILVSRILALLPHLTHLEVDSDSSYEYEWGLQLPILKTAFQKTLSLHSLRTFCLSNYAFSDATELDSFLSHATALLDLSLKDIQFDNSSWRRSRTSPRDATVVLTSLQVREIDPQSIYDMLAAFSAVDIRHLRSLNVESMASMIPLLAANAQTIQKVRYSFSAGEELDDPDIFAGNRLRCLRSIEVIEPNVDMNDTLKAFGNLSHLTALTTISLHFNDGLDARPLDTEQWSELDTVLAQAGDSLEVVNIYALADHEYERVVELDFVRHWLPSVAGKISLHVPVEIRRLW